MACRHHYVSLVVLRASLSAVFAIFLSVLFLRPTTVLAAGVVGTGTPESCTEAALDDALAGGGLVTFNCGMEPVTIALTAEKVITAETAKTTVDGAGLVTLSGGDAVRVFNVNEGAALEVQYLTVANGDGRTASGGGIYNEGTLTVTNSTLRDSSARYGGGIYNEGSLDVTNSTLSGNSGGGAGGIWNEGAANISNSTLTANTANRVGTFGGFGGGILNYSGTAQVINSTIADNRGFAGVVNFATLTITNTIIANNLVGDCVGNPVNGADNLIGDAANSCGFVNGVNGNIVGADPMLDPAGLQDNGGPTETIALLPGSPAIDAGAPAVCAGPPVNGVDQRGYTRPGEGSTNCSIGAYEYDSPGPITMKVVGTGTPESCTEAALDAALAGGGRVVFDCGVEPAMITITVAKEIAQDTSIDGGGLVTISGGNMVGVFAVNEDISFTVENLTIANGKIPGGGGIHNEDGTVTVTNSTFAGNSATVGGGIYNTFTGTVTVANSIFAGNSAIVEGGGIANGGALTVTNSTFSGNSAGDYGGAIFNYGGGPRSSSVTGLVRALTVTNSTFSGNSAREDGGISNLLGMLTLRNTIVANSPTGGDCASSTLVNDGGHNLIEDASSSCGLANGVNGNIVGVDPLLDPAGLQDNGGPTQTIALLFDSPAINAGDPDVCADPPVNNLDQRGYVRPSIGHTQCSIGAYEADPEAIPTPTSTATPTQTPRIGACMGDCSGNGQVTVDELVTLLSIALRNARSSACPYGVPSGAALDVALLIQAVNSALSGCGG